jgi:hypothetical protein
MAKVTGPLFSLDARATVGKAITYSYWRGVNYVRARVVPKNPNSSLQQAIRLLVKDASEKWRAETSPVDSAYKGAYDAFAEGKPFSGFNAYMKDAVGKNGGSAYTAPFVPPTEPGDNTA